MDNDALQAMAKLAMKTSARVDALEHALTTAIALLPAPSAEKVVMELESFVEGQVRACQDPVKGKPAPYVRYQSEEAVQIAEQIEVHATRAKHRPAPRSFQPAPSFRPLPDYP